MNQDEREILLKKLAEINSKYQKTLYELESANKKLQKYEEMTQKAEQASRMKSQFLANMSHEIRTPLNAIEGFSRVMAETDSPDERMKYMEIIESNNTRLMALIDDILDISRVEAGEISIKKSMTNLNDLCRDLKNIFKFRCPDTVQLEWNEPNMKVWIIREGQEVAQYTNHYRGYGHYQDHEELLPADISDVAKKAWDMLKEAPFDDAMLEKMKALAE